jgi:hypothetical protein
MIYACGTNAICKHDEQESQVIDEQVGEDVYRKGNESCKVENHEDQICLYFKIENKVLKMI